jgi:hypothetical protein
MARYTNGTVTVEARQFDQATRGPVFLCSDLSNLLPVRHLDWIITLPDGTHRVISSTEFVASYRPAV